MKKSINCISYRSMFSSSLTSHLYCLCRSKIGMFLQIATLVALHSAQLHCNAFVIRTIWMTKASRTGFPHQPLQQSQRSNSWSTSDDWDNLSRTENGSVYDSRTLFGQNRAQAFANLLSDDIDDDWESIRSPKAGAAMVELDENESEQKKEDSWLEEAINGIFDSESEDSVGNSFAQTTPFEEQMNDDIAMLVRCNQGSLAHDGLDLSDKNPNQIVTSEESLLLDECEFISLDEETNEDDNKNSIMKGGGGGGGISRTTDRQGQSSHERVPTVTVAVTGIESCKLQSQQQQQQKQLQIDVPIYHRDGEFVFIDEEACIGCMQCVTAAPASFKMLDNGRARTFEQRYGKDVQSAVASCPVDCMHHVSYNQLKELEIARDIGLSGLKSSSSATTTAIPKTPPTTTSSASTVSTSTVVNTNDLHKHFGHSKATGYIPRVPLHASRRDANTRSSLYHFMKNKCINSSNCPSRGCYDCPRYQSDPESNPFFQQRLQQSYSIRAQYFIQTGLADSIRKTADL